ncbi:hypothetical protein NQ318_022518 [Aromia moschata]|uniref:HTH psq-type domain-containing protein n=1 Tax=Aromia moschata TaxID=1265417 RepID=A0AAV8XKF5_9CUCU|nr:hypothetical protein NQ318_022518 [Aromia moschata]
MGKICKNIRAKWNSDAMLRAVNAVDAGRLSQRAASERFEIPKRTLRNHLASGSVVRKLGRHSILTREQEKDLVSQEMNIKNKPEGIFNMDEKGCRLTLHHQQAVLAQKGVKRLHLVAPEHAENVTVVGCVSAIGTAIPPIIIFKVQLGSGGPTILGSKS